MTEKHKPNCKIVIADEVVDRSGTTLNKKYREVEGKTLKECKKILEDLK